VDHRQELAQGAFALAEDDQVHQRVTLEGFLDGKGYMRAAHDGDEGGVVPFGILDNAYRRIEVHGDRGGSDDIRPEGGKFLFDLGARILAHDVVQDPHRGPGGLAGPGHIGQAQRG